MGKSAGVKEIEKFLKGKRTMLNESIDESSDWKREADPNSLCKRNCRPNLRNYVEEYIKFGFIEFSSNLDKPQCPICYKILLKEALKPAKL